MFIFSAFSLRPAKLNWGNKLCSPPAKSKQIFPKTNLRPDSSDAMRALNAHVQKLCLVSRDVGKSNHRFNVFNSVALEGLVGSFCVHMKRQYIFRRLEVEMETAS